MIKSSNDIHSSLENLEILSNILPFTIMQNYNYKIYFFYGNELLLNSFHTAFPYYILFQNVVVLLSADGNLALPYVNYELAKHFRDLFDTTLKKSSQLITTCSYAEDLLQYLLKEDQTSETFNTIEFQPCLSTFLTKSMLQKYARPELPKRDLLIEATYQRCRQLTNMKNHSCIFSKSGLTNFALYGTLSDIPSSYINPIDIPDRIQLLESLYQACSDETELLRIVNPIIFSLPEYLTFTIRQNKSIDISGFDSTGKSFNFIHITEPTLLDAFEDFYQYLLISDLCCTKEETLKEIEYAILKLKSL